MLTMQRQRGLGLVELLVGVAIAMVLIAGASLVYVNSLRGTTASSALMQVNQTLRTVSGVIEYDLHRAGYWGRAAAGGATPNPFMVRAASGSGTASTDLFVSAGQDCILYTFDLNSDGVVDPAGSEFFGFWFDRANRRLMVLDQRGASPVSDTAATGRCDTYSWLPMNFPAQVTIDQATFSTGGSQCIAYAPTTYNPASAPGTTYATWALDTASAAANYRAACDTVASGSNQVPAGSLPAGVTATVPATFTGRAEVRQVIVTLRASHAREAGLTRTLTTTVRLRNDRSL